MRLKQRVKAMLPEGVREAKHYAKQRALMRRRANMAEEEITQEITGLYDSTMGRLCDLSNPHRFTEKIQWIKAFHSTPEYGRLADKYLVREYVAERVGEKHLVGLINVWDDADSIDFRSLPSAFAMKATHGSGWNVVVPSRDGFDERHARQRLRRWLSLDYGLTGTYERHYSHCVPRIIAEEYMEEFGGGLYDYKIHCFGGKPMFIQCIGDRDFVRHTGCQRHFDLHWNDLGWTFEDYPQFPYDVPAPEKLDEMIGMASALSAGLPYVRVDLYNLGDRVLFGEMTLTPASGLYPYQGTWTVERDIELGGMFVLPGRIG